MDCNFKFKIEFKLLDFASIAVSTNLWEHADIKKKVKDHFTVNGIPTQVFSPKGKHWCAIVNKVSKHADTLQLPKELLIKIKSILEPIGDKIYYWNLYILGKLGLEPEYTEKLYWTPCGSIDENKIFQLHWEKLDDFKNLADDIIILLSCLFAQKGFICKNIIYMRNKTQLLLAPVKIINNECNSYAIIVIWLCIYFSKETSKGIEIYKNLKKSNSVATKLFYECKAAGLLLAAKYFWNKLTETEKQFFNVQGVEKGMLQFMNINSYQEEKFIELIIFLENNLPAEERFKYVLIDFVPIFKFIMNVWPFQKMVELMVDTFLDHLKSEQLEFLYLYSLYTLAGDNDSCRFINKGVCRQILYKVFPKISKDVKVRGLLSNDRFLVKLFNLFDLPVLIFILTDKDLLDRKEELILSGIAKFRNLIKTSKLELLDKFVRNVFPSEIDQKKFKLKINIAQDLINQGRTDLADKLINWISNSEEEKKIMKKQIDPLKFGRTFKSFKYEKFDEFLLWQCDTEEERKSLRQNMKKNNEFVCDNIVKIWNVNDKINESKCLEFLNWLSETNEEAEELKNKLIVDEKLVEKYCDTLPSADSFGRIDALFQFFSLTPEKVLQIKEKIVTNLHNWIYRYFVTKENYKLAEKIIDYIFIDENVKKAAMVKYINSANGAFLIFKMYKMACEGYREGMLFLLNVWVKLYGNINKINEKLDLITPDDFWESYVMFTVRNLLADLKRGKTITENDLFKYEF